MPNGYSYNIMVTSSGTGASGYSGTNATNIYLNGISVGTLPAASSGLGFGAVECCDRRNGDGICERDLLHFQWGRRELHRSGSNELR